MNEEIQLFTNGLAFCDEINKFSYTQDIRNFNKLNEFSNSFMKVYNIEKAKLPYHINILDLLWANENAHSRIFAELLKQKNGNKFEILESFLEYLEEINPNFNYRPNKPIITSEKDRIDLLISDKEYVLIIENKIHYAVDQEHQIARYIEKVKPKGYKESQIYVIYLTRNEDKTLTDQSWQSQGADYKERFKERYFPLTFRNDILPWLKNNVLPNCKIKDVYLKSTLEQYIDYLEGMFNLRKIQHKMNTELQDHIRTVLGFSTIPEDNFSKLKEKFSEIEQVKNQLNLLTKSVEKECWEKWLKNLKQDFPNLPIVDYSKAERYEKVGVLINIKGFTCAFLIEKDTNIYYGIGRHNSSLKLNEELKIILKPYLEGFKETEWWYGWKYTSFQNAYSRLKSLIEEIIKQEGISK
ncbi:MAG: PD-(D/E)XK nuclease family protein [Paludibacteraceae bacterium]|nr:PD-(D/E)XK nuclease family protein [Paludibacteraceae bacterium]